jgi:YVTN family beta-propeller protein
LHGAGGSVWIYLAAPRDEGARLRFRISGLEAVAASGETFPLSLALSRIGRRSLRRERLLATGSLPAGSYAGLRVTVDEASLAGGQGESALRVPDGPTAVDVSFSVARRRAEVLSLTLPFNRAVVDGFRFVPAFDASVAREPALGLAAVAACRRAGAVFLFDKVSGRSFAVVPVDGRPTSVALSRQARQAFVSLAGSHAVAIVGLEEKSLLERVPLGAGDAPEELALGPDGRLLLTANAGSGTVSVIDVAGRVEVDRIRVGEGPRSVRVGRSGLRAYVLNSLSDTISVIDIPRRAVAATLTTEAEPLRGELDRSGKRLYVIHRSSPYLTVIDTRRLEVVQRVYVGMGATALAIDPRSGRILLARAGAGTVDVYDPSSLLPLDAIPVGGEPGYLAVDGEGNNLHVVLPRENRIQVLRLSNKKLLSEVDVGADPSWVALMGER